LQYHGDRKYHHYLGLCFQQWRKENKLFWSTLVDKYIIESAAAAAAAAATAASA
jgi:hypothetical protein